MRKISYSYPTIMLKKIFNKEDKIKKSLIQFVMIIPLALLVFFTLSCSDENGVTEPTANTQSDIDAITEVMNKYKQAAEANDFEAWMALWDDNGIRMAPDEPAAIGIEQIRTQMAPNFTPGISNQVTIDIKEIQVNGNSGFSRADFALFITLPDGSTIDLVGKALTIFKKQADKSWKIYIDCFNFH